MSFRGVGVDIDFEAKQQTLDGHFVGGRGAASGLGDLTREQVKAMARRERKQFVATVLMIGLVLFGMTYVLADIADLGAQLSLSF